MSDAQNTFQAMQQAYPVHQHPKAAEPYVHQAYPKWKHHASATSVMVHDPEQEASLGDGWADAPFAENRPSGLSQLAPPGPEPCAGCEEHKRKNLEMKLMFDGNWKKAQDEHDLSLQLKQQTEILAADLLEENTKLKDSMTALAASHNKLAADNIALKGESTKLTEANAIAAAQLAKLTEANAAVLAELETTKAALADAQAQAKKKPAKSE